MRENRLGNAIQGLELEAGLLFKQLVLHAIAQVQPSQKILIAGGRDNRVFVRLQVLDVGLGQGMPVLHLRDECALALNHAVGHFINRNPGHHGQRLALGDAVVAVNGDGSSA